MLVASIDVGIVNLGVAFVYVDDATSKLQRILHVENVNTTLITHQRVPQAECTLGHTKTATDRVMHFIQERADMFAQCAVVLIERQPIQGHTDVEQVLFMHFRDRAELVSPNSMHKLLQIGHLTYEWRKFKTVEFADTMLDPAQFPEYHQMERKHDVADALCLLIYWAYTRHLRTSPPAAAATSLPDTGAAPAQTSSGESGAATPVPESSGQAPPANPFAKYAFVASKPLFRGGAH